MVTQSPFVRFKVTSRQVVGAHPFQTTCPWWRPSDSVHGCWGKGTGHQNNRIQRLLLAFHFSCCSLPNAKGKVMSLFSILSRFIDPERSWTGFWSKGALYNLQAPILLLPASFVPSIAFRFPQWSYYYTMVELFTIKRSSSGEIYPGLT